MNSPPITPFAGICCVVNSLGGYFLNQSDVLYRIPPLMAVVEFAAPVVNERLAPVLVLVRTNPVDGSNPVSNNLPFESDVAVNGAEDGITPVTPLGNSSI